MITPKSVCDELSDLEIIRKALVAVDYFSCLYDRYEKQLLRYIRRVAFADDDEAADILQDAFIKIWRNLYAYDPNLKLSSWMYRIVHNEAISFVRRKKSFGKDLRIAWDENLLVDRQDDSDAADLLEYRDKLTHRTLALLPEPYREVLVLKFLENMGYEEISDILKIPEGTVATRINRAKKAFRKMMNHPENQPSWL